MLIDSLFRAFNRQNSLKYSLNLVSLWCLIGLACYVATALLSEDLPQTLQNSFLYFLSIYLTCLSVARKTREDLGNIFLGFCFLSVLVLFLSMMQAFRFIDVPLQNYAETEVFFYNIRSLVPPGFFSNPNGAGLLALSCLVSAVLAYSFLGKKSSFFFSAFLLLAIFSLSIMFIYSSRAALFSSSILFLFVLIEVSSVESRLLPSAQRQILRLIVKFAAPFVLILAFCAVVFRTDLSEYLSQRDFLWDQYLGAISTRPLLGYGAAPFLSLSSHNSFLQVLYQYGFAGFAVNISFVTWGFSSLYKSRNLVGFAPAVSLLAAGAYSIFDVNGFGFFTVLTLPVIVAAFWSFPGTSLRPAKVRRFRKNEA